MRDSTLRQTSIAKAKKLASLRYASSYGHEARQGLSAAVPRLPYALLELVFKSSTVGTTAGINVRWVIANLEVRVLHGEGRMTICQIADAKLHFQILDA